jgi:flavin reductase (DIM6/NTAB) family NADH-FMN oxidoreductase RutF
MTDGAPTKEGGYMDLRSDFKLGMRRLASGVSIVATTDEQGPEGFLATSVSSVAPDPWPCLLVCVNKSASSHDAFIRTKVFSVNVLAERQVDIATLQFARIERGALRRQRLGDSRNGCSDLSRCARKLRLPTDDDHDRTDAHGLDRACSCGSKRRYCRGATELLRRLL